MAWFYFAIYRCDRPPHWVFAFLKGPEWKSDRDANRYTSDLVHYSGMTDTPFTVHSWRHSGRPGDQWVDLGWVPASCP